MTQCSPKPACPIVATLLVAAILSLPAPVVAQDGASWTPAPWRFLRDGWPNGIGFDCTGCGGPVSVYVRVKVGFCDCSKGVSDDDEIDRVGDVDLVAWEFQPYGAGRETMVAGARGRLRVYRTLGAPQRTVATLAAGRDCNAIVATAVSDESMTAEQLAAATALLSSPEVARFIDAKMSGR